MDADTGDPDGTDVADAERWADGSDTGSAYRQLTRAPGTARDGTRVHNYPVTFFPPPKMGVLVTGLGMTQLPLSFA